MERNRELIAAGIRRAALRTGRSDAEIRMRVNVGSSTWAKWIRAEAIPSNSNLLRIAEVCDCTVEDIESGFTDFAEDRDLCAQ